MQKKTTALERVQSYVRNTNKMLSYDMLSVAKKRCRENGIYLIAVFLDTNIVYPNLIDCMCSHTSTIFYGITKKNGKICILLKDEND